MHRFIKSNYLTAALIAADAAMFLLIWFGLYYFRDKATQLNWLTTPINPVENYAQAAAVLLPYWLLCIWFHGLYGHQGQLSSINQMSRQLKTFFAGTMGSLALAFFFKDWSLGRSVLLLTGPLFLLWLYLSRTTLRAWKRSHYRQGRGVTKVLIVGTGRTARMAVRRIADHPESGYRIIGLVEAYTRKNPQKEAFGRSIIGSVRDIQSILAKTHTDEVLLAVPRMPQREVMDIVLACEHSQVKIKLVTNLFQVITDQVRIDTIDEIPVIELRNAHLAPAQAFIKRIFDVIAATVILAVLAVPMLIILILIKLDSNGPVIFRQQRVGLHGQHFTMYKFRSMRIDVEQYAVAPTTGDDPRITTIGQWLRKFSLDEFPQLFNVLRGDMSMVGPRPEMQFLVDQYEEWQRRRLEVKPGVTGLWQIVGRKNLPLSLNMEYDFYYIKNQSLLFDVVILIKTIPAVLFGRGAF